MSEFIFSVSFETIVCQKNEREDSVTRFSSSTLAADYDGLQGMRAQLTRFYVKYSAPEAIGVVQRNVRNTTKINNEK